MSRTIACSCEQTRVKHAEAICVNKLSEKMPRRHSGSRDVDLRSCHAERCADGGSDSGRSSLAGATCGKERAGCRAATRKSNLAIG